MILFFDNPKLSIICVIFTLFFLAIASVSAPGIWLSFGVVILIMLTFRQPRFGRRSPDIGDTRHIKNKFLLWNLFSTATFFVVTFLIFSFSKYHFLIYANLSESIINYTSIYQFFYGISSAQQMFNKEIDPIWMIVGITHRVIIWMFSLFITTFFLIGRIDINTYRYPSIFYCIFCIFNIPATLFIYFLIFPNLAPTINSDIGILSEWSRLAITTFVATFPVLATGYATMVIAFRSGRP